MSFTDYHYYEDLAAAASYTLPATAMATLFVELGRMGTDGINVQFWDGGGWNSSLNNVSAVIDDQFVGGLPLFQDNAQSHRVTNDGVGARKISLTGVIRT